MTRGTAAGFAIGALVVLAGLLRFVHLDADPYFPTWTQYIVDEGRWNAVARDLALFETFPTTRLAQLHLLLSPGYQAVNYGVFRALGVEFWTARLLAAASGTLIVLVVVLALRRHVTSFALVLGTTILAFETDLLAESRLALPEVPSLLAVLLAFLALMLRPRTRWNAFLAGVLALVAVAIKATSVLVVAVLPLIVLLFPATDPVRERVTRLLAFALALAVPAIAAAAVVLAFGNLDTSALAAMGTRIAGFLSAADPRFIVWRFFESAQLEIRNLLLLGVWFCSWFWICRDRQTSVVTRELYLASGLWAGWWLIVWAINDYSPGRYVVHFVVPAVIHIMAGLSLGGGDTIARVGAWLGRLEGLPRWAALVWLALPGAIYLATILVGIGQFAGLDLTRVTVRVVAIVALAGIAAFAAQRSRRLAEVTVGLLLYPVAMTLVWLGGRELGLFGHFWTFASGTRLALWVGCSALVAGIGTALAMRPLAKMLTTPVQFMVVGWIAAIFLAQGLHPVLAPTYSIRDAARQIERDFARAAEVRTMSAASLFLGNRLRFSELVRNESDYDVLVLFEHNLSSQRLLNSPKAAGFERVATYPVVFHPRYEYDENKFGPARIGVFLPK